MVIYTTKLIYLKDKSMCNNFTLTRKVKSQNLAQESGNKNGCILCTFTDFPVFSLEKRALQINDGAFLNLMLAWQQEMSPRIISILREIFQLDFESMARQIMTKLQFIPKIP